MVNTKRINILLQQFADGEISRAAYEELIEHFKLAGNDDEIYKAMDEVWRDTNANELDSQVDEVKFYQDLVNSKSFKKGKVAYHLNGFMRYAAAAVVLVTLSFGIYFYENQKTSNKNKFAKHDILPGGNKATLTLADGRVIDLNKVNNGDLAYQSGISIHKTGNGQLIYSIQSKNKQHSPADELTYNTIATPRAGQYQVNLPDGSKVWLNSESSIKFPVQFSRAERRVELRGEAYFEVAKVYKNLKSSGERLPFLVSSENQTVEVLGTHFNVNAYPGERVTRTTLFEGAVKVFADKIQSPSYLKPNQQAVLIGKTIVVSTADVEEAMAWKNGLFIFNKQNLGDIMKQVERWYNVDVVFSDEALKQEEFNGTTSRFKNISQLLEVLESTGSVHFKIEGRRIVAMK